MIAKLIAPLRGAPATVPCLAAMALFVVWAGDQAGYPLTHWAPGGIAVLVLLAMTAALIAPRARALPPAVLVALGALAAYTALSFLSILWADVPGAAWEGADRTLLYLLVFALFATWPQRGDAASVLLVAWILAITGLGIYVLLHADAAGAGSLQRLFPGARLAHPSGYPNANAAQWLIACWPAALLARSRELHPALRGLLAGCAVLLAEVALLSQSRGALYATPVMVVLVFAAIPGRIRTFATLVPIAGAIAAASFAVLRVGDRLTAAGAVRAGDVHAATRATLLAAAIAAITFGVLALADRRLRPGSLRARLRLLLAAAAVLALLAGIAGGAVAAGDPVARVRSAWHSFKGGYNDTTGGNRLLSGLGSNRYDFYRVALDQFAANPAAGIGADNFQQQYLRHGRSTETPRYPHSLELRVLAQTGVLGALLAAAGTLAALLAAAVAMRRRDPLSAAVAAAASAGFVYWVVHGSFDWFWEFAGLGAPAFALLGIACALCPGRARRAPAARTLWRGSPAAALTPAGSLQASGTRPAEPVARRSGARPAPVPEGVAGRPASQARPRSAMPRSAAAFAVAGVVALAAAGSLAAPWISQLEIQQAARVWVADPAQAYAQLRDAASVDPLSDEAWVLAGSIAVRRGELRRADGDFARALARVPGDSYALLERGAIASELGRSGAALSLLVRAARLSPRDPVIGEALATVRHRRRVDIVALNTEIFDRAQRLA